MEKRYVVKWEIDQVGENPLEAIKQAILALPHVGNSDTLATVFDVVELDINTNEVIKTYQIDILETNPFDSEEVALFLENESADEEQTFKRAGLTQDAINKQMEEDEFDDMEGHF